MYTVKMCKHVKYRSFLYNCSISICCKNVKKKIIYCIYTMCSVFGCSVFGVN